MADDRRALARAFDRKLDERAALLIGEAYGSARMHRHGQRLRAVAQMKLEHPAVKIEVDASVARTKRRQRRMHQAWLEGHHSIPEIRQGSPAVGLAPDDAEIFEL